MICAHCETENAPNSRYCSRCGEPFTHKCGSCGAFGPADMDCCDNPFVDILTIGAGVALGLLGFDLIEDLFD